MKVAAGPKGEIRLRITDDPPENGCKPAVDYLFRSAALHFPGRAVAAILTGMGNDGTAGLRLLKRGGCFSIAQDEASCVVFGMPKEAIAGRSGRYRGAARPIGAGHRPLGARGSGVIKLQPEEHKSLAQYIYSLCAIALDESKAYLIEGRLARLVEETGCGSYGGLVERAKSDSSRALERRIVDAITTNETLVLSRHLALRSVASQDRSGIDRPPRATGAARIRIWSAACSTGQEIYSIAILLKELLGDPDRYGVRLLGTDISDDAVARASRGLFSPVEISRGLSEAQRDKYFTPVGGGWQIRDEIRAMASFKKLNLMADFSALGRFDVIFCRNVAIYFTERRQGSRCSGEWNGRWSRRATW
jgi:chemotaxis protein methyltransferase CheR